MADSLTSVVGLAGGEGDAPVLKVVPAKLAPWVMILGALGAIASTFMTWTGTADFPGNLTIAGNPADIQKLTIVGGVLVVLFALVAVGAPGLRWLAPRGASKASLLVTIGLAGTTWYTVLAIAWVEKGLANVDPGGWLAAVATLVALAGALSLRGDANEQPKEVKLASWLEILVIAATMLVAMLVITFGLKTPSDDPELFIAFCVVMILGIWGLYASGLIGTFSAILGRNRPVAAVSVLISAMLFPFTQDSDALTSIGANILIFAAVALGLNIVVGLAGLLDLGYVAFLGVGAFASALLSGSPASPLRHHQMPFWVAALFGIGVAVVAGLIIGAPTLRLRGDYLAIVTLGFGEIFRLAMNNLNGTGGPNITNGPQGIYALPELNLFGYDFGTPHQILGHTFGKFANYYVFLVLLLGVVVFIFARVNDSRIGRAWVAIREDETAATAMGINGFRFKLLAFALGASLAGFAGTVQAHVTTTVTPDQYQFAGNAPPNSAFLLAAVVLGGMGTITGPILGAALLYLIPVKLEFMAKYQLLAFGAALILMMRLRPEGLIASRRRQLEFHEEEVAEAEALAVINTELAGA
jgi:branched-chain amino acid transport system permease protein